MTITDKVIQSIGGLLKTQKTLPFALTHQAIADHYQVSLTPARNAVIALVEQGLLLRKDNGRLEINPSAATKRSSAANRKAVAQVDLTNDWQEAIIKETIKRSLRQNTDYLREEATAQQFNVSRTLVRQLFSQLAGAGLMQHIPRCGWRVHPFDEKEMMDYLRIRELLELEALTLARPRLQKEELQALLDSNQPANKKRRKGSLDNSLHAYWIERCDNRYIQEFFSRHGDYYSALFDYASLDKSVKSTMAQEHRDILQCLIDQDWRGARKALSHHIRDQSNSVLRFIDFSLLDK